MRTAKPSKQQLAAIKKGHKAPSREHRDNYVMSPVLSESDIKRIFKETPETTFVTISRAAAAWVNEVALQSLFGERDPIGILPSDPEANPSNYQGTAQIGCEPARVPIHVGMTVMLTKNVNKEMDFVNGMSATVEGLYRSGLRVRTRTGYQVMVFPWTDDDRNVFFPMRIGYASTLMKMQGATLPHLTVWLDAPNVEAAGYVALSRVELDANWRFVGDPTVHHFTPATGY